MVSADLAVIFAQRVMAGVLDGTSPLYWAVGDGGVTGDDQSVASKAWDAAVIAGTQVPHVNDTGLIREVFRKAIAATDIKYVDASGNVSAVPTNRLQITSLYLEAEPSAGGPVYLREWGIVGGAKFRDGTGGAASTVGSGFLVDHKTHVTYVKQPTSRLERVVILTF